MSVSKRGNKWQVRLNEPNVKYHRYSFDSHAEAERWEEQARADLALGLRVSAPSDNCHGSLSLVGYYDKFIAETVEFKNTANKHRSRLRSFIAVVGDIQVSELSQRHFDTFIRETRSKLKPATINIIMRAAERIHKEASKEFICTNRVEVNYIVDRDYEGRLKFLSEEEEKTFVRSISNMEDPAFLHTFNFLIDTGCRPSEILDSNVKTRPIQWTNLSKSAGGTGEDPVDPATGRQRAVVIFGKGKTGSKSRRVLPLTQRALDAVLYFKDMNYDRPFSGITVRHFSDLIRNHRYENNLDNEIVLYTLRHTCASRLVQRGASIFKVMKWLGHTDIKTTQVYAKLRTSDVFELSELLQ